MDQLPKWTHEDVFNCSHELTWQGNGREYFPEHWKLLEKLGKQFKKKTVKEAAKASAKAK